MPQARPMIAPGTFFVSLGATAIAAMVTRPTTMPGHCQSSGDSSAAPRCVPLGAPSSLGSCATAMMTATPDM